MADASRHPASTPSPKRTASAAAIELRPVRRSAASATHEHGAGEHGTGSSASSRHQRPAMDSTSSSALRAAQHRRSEYLAGVALLLLVVLLWTGAWPLTCAPISVP